MKRLLIAALAIATAGSANASCAQPDENRVGDPSLLYQ
jgi:hypothetical protein